MTEPHDEGDDGRRFSFYIDKRVALLSAGLIAAVIAWLIVRTPTSEGFAYHPIGESEGAPTFVLLHGYGAAGDDLTGLGEALVAGAPGLRVVCVEGTHNVGLGGRAWYRHDSERAPTVAGITRFVEALVDDGTPRERIAIGGFSQGAAIATDVSARMPGLAGTAILSGDHSTRQPVGGRLFVSHGRSDPNIGFGAATRRLDEYAQTAEVTFAPFAGGHSVRPVQDELARWLAETLGLSAR